MENYQNDYEQQDGSAGKELKHHMNDARIETRIAIFCAIILAMSVMFQMIDPQLGSFVFNIMWPTMVLSIVVLCYKIIFGYDPLTLIAIVLAYIALLGLSFNERYVIFCASTALFMVFILKVFVFLFVRGYDREQNPAVYVLIGILLPVLVGTMLYLNKTKVNSWLSERFEYFEDNGYSANNTMEEQEREPIFMPTTNGQEQGGRYVPPHMRKK